MATLQITCFGNFRIALDGRAPHVLLTDKARGLLVYLALEPQVHQRNELTPLFWSGYSEESARNSLRQTLHLLRQFLAEEEVTPWLLVTRQTVQLNPAAPCHSDAATFTTLLAAVTNHAHADLLTCPTCLAGLRQAVDLYRSNFLAGLGAIDSAAFEEWRRITQERLHLQMLDALNWLATAAERAGDLAGALQATQRQLALEPWLETAHRQIMRLLAQQGQRAAAEMQYQRCRQVLAEELRVEPDAETTALYEQIRKGTGSRGLGFDVPPDRSPETSASAVESRTSKPSPQLPLRDWAEMPAVDFFVERSAEMAQLTAWLLPPPGQTPADTNVLPLAGRPSSEGAPAQLISLLGMGGIGKTTLAARVTKAVAHSFPVVIWRSLLNAPPLSQLLRDWLQILSRQTLATFPDKLDEQLRLLLSYLWQERCLLVLDNVESIFTTDPPVTEGIPPPQSHGGEFGGTLGASSAGVMRPGYEGYDQLFQRLANSDHQSCLLLTSREQPYALVRLGRQAQATATGRIRLLPLTGLDQQAGQALLESNGLHASVAEAAQLVKNYSGNPLALQIVAATIADFFGGDVAAFQQEEGAFFDGMRLVLDQQFARLSPLERDILVWLAIEREASTAPTLRSNIVQSRPEGTRTAPLLEALQSLQNRSLLEKRTSGFTLQNVIIEYATEYLVAQVCQEITELRGALLDAKRVNLHSKIVTSFLNRFALLKTQAKEYVRQSQRRLIVRPISERLVAELGQKQVVQCISLLLDALRAADVKRGYAAGNLLNLLVQMGEELVGYDFSHLPVWQADLRGLMFVSANFSFADLTNAAFTAGIKINKASFRAPGELWVAGIDNSALCLWRTADGQLTDAFRREGNSCLPLVFRPDSQILASAKTDYSINLWSAVTGECVRTLVGHSSAIYGLALSADGAFLASGTAEQQVYLWNLHSGRLCQRLGGHEQGVEALAFSPDGHHLATGSGGGVVRLWQIGNAGEQGQLSTILQGHTHNIGALAFSPDGAWLASGSHDGSIRLWDLNHGAECVHILHGHTSLIRVLLFQPRPTPHPSDDSPLPSAYLLASGSADQTARLWDITTGQVCYTLLGHSHEVQGLTFTPDGQQLASSGLDQRIFLWNPQTGQAIYSFHAYHYGLNSVRFSPGGTLVASGGGDRLVYVWHVAAGATSTPAQHSQLRHVLRGHSGFLRAVAFSQSGRLVASSGAERTIRLWDIETGQRLSTLAGHTGAVLALTFASSQPTTEPGTTLLASAGADRSIRLWTLTEEPWQEPRAQSEFRGHEDEILTLAFAPSGDTLISGSMDGTVRIWDVVSGVTRYCLTGHTDAISAVAISPDGGTLATSSFDHTVRVWDITTGQCIHIEQEGHIGPYAVGFSPDGEVLAYTGNDFAIYLWPWRTRTAPTALRGHMDHVIALDFSPTAPLLVSCGDDNTIRFWDLTTQSCCQILHMPGPYTGMNITGVTGISAAQKTALRALGAVEE